MGTISKIEWLRGGHTASPWYGCQHAKLPDGSDHPGCPNCYAEALSKRNPGTLGEWGADGRRVVSKSFHDACRKWNAAALKANKRSCVFPSLCDPFEDWTGPIHNNDGDELCICDGCGKRVFFTEDCEGEAALCQKLPRLLTMNDLRRDLFATIDKCPMLDFLLLTKRPQNIRKMWPAYQNNGRGDRDFTPNVDGVMYGGLRMDNVWLLYSASDQKSLDAGLPSLLHCRDLVPVIGLSLEPLTGPIDLSHYLPPTPRSECPPEMLPHNLDWVIVGGESGHGARPCKAKWIADIVNQCRAASVPVFVKQLGSEPDFVGFSESFRWPLKDKKGGDCEEWPKSLRVREFPRMESEAAA